MLQLNLNLRQGFTSICAQLISDMPTIKRLQLYLILRQGFTSVCVQFSVIFKYATFKRLFMVGISQSELSSNNISSYKCESCCNCAGSCKYLLKRSNCHTVGPQLKISKTKIGIYFCKFVGRKPRF